MGAAVIPIIGAVISVAGSMQQGAAAEQSAEFDSQQLNRNALAAEASSQREAIEERRRGQIAESRARAVAVASGTTSTDVGVSDLISKIGAESEYNALAALYEGKQKAQSLRVGGEAAMFEGGVAKQAAKTKAVGTVMSAFSKGASRSYG